MKTIRTFLIIVALAIPAVSGWQEWTELGTPACPVLEDVLDEAENVRLVCAARPDAAPAEKLSVHLFRPGSPAPWFYTSPLDRSVTLTLDRPAFGAPDLRRALELAGTEEVFGASSPYHDEAARERVLAVLQRRLAGPADRLLIRLEAGAIVVREQAGGPVLERISLGPRPKA